MNILNNAVILLSGPIDNASDDGVGVRRQIIEQSHNAGVMAQFIDPTNKPTSGFKEIGGEKQYIHNLAETGQFFELALVVKEFRYQDLRMVDISDIVIAYVDPTIHMCGTYEEVFRAKVLDKAMFLVVIGGVSKCPKWLFDVFLCDNMFGSVEELVSRLALINSDQYDFDQKYIQTKALLELI